MKKFKLLIFILSFSILAYSGIKKEILKHIKYLSDNKTEGRAPATEGIKIAQSYFVNQLKKSGVSPAFNGSYFQKFKVYAQKPLKVNLTLTGDKKRIELSYGDDYVLNSGIYTEETSGEAELIFSGFGIKADEFGWDDFKGEKFKGKILIVLVNDPGMYRNDMFFGKKMSYYGRWIYKFEQAERVGASGVLIVHNTKGAGYGWNVVRNSWGKEEMFLKTYKNLKIKGWITEGLFKKILKASNLSLEKIIKLSLKKDFKPITLPFKAKWSIKNRKRIFYAQNSGGCTGKGNETILLTAHIDHLGKNPSLKGDNIFNGALDNASGVSALLVLEKKLKKEKLKRKVCFIVTTLEEYGLLGAEYLSKTTDKGNILININIDMLNPFGKTKDIRFIGLDFINIKPYIKKFFKGRSLKVQGDPMPEIGMLYRMDHLPFMGKKIPSISLLPGIEGTNGENLILKWKWFFMNIYHTPKDEISDFWKTNGMVQQINVLKDLIKFIDKNIRAISFKDNSSTLILKPVFRKYGN